MFIYAQSFSFRLITGNLGWSRTTHHYRIFVARFFVGYDPGNSSITLEPPWSCTHSANAASLTGASLPPLSFYLLATKLMVTCLKPRLEMPGERKGILSCCH